MNYWPRWINAISNKTAHLTLMQMGAYDRLLDHAYKTEQPLPGDLDACCRIARASTKAEREAVSAVLEEFFDLSAVGYTQVRVTVEIELAKPKIAAARANGVRGGRPKGTYKEPSGFPEGTQDEPEAKAPHPHSSSPTSKKRDPHTPAKRGQAAVSLSAWLEAIKETGEKAIPDDDPVFAYADSVGIPRDFLRLHWLEFRHRYTQPTAKRYIDWRAVFRKSVRGNWAKLWWLDPASGQYGLTTVGMQAERAHRERTAA